jgi:hypothetical protein
MGEGSGPLKVREGLGTGAVNSRYWTAAPLAMGHRRSDVTAARYRLTFPLHRLTRLSSVGSVTTLWRSSRFATYQPECTEDRRRRQFPGAS